MIPLFQSDTSVLAADDRTRAALLVIALEMKYRFDAITYLLELDPYQLHVVLTKESLADWRTNYQRMEMWARTGVTQSLLQSERWDINVQIRFWAAELWQPAGAVRIDQYVVPVNSAPQSLPEPPAGLPDPSEIQARAQEPDLHVMIGSLCLLAGKISTAKEAFQRAIMLDENKADAWMHLGNAYYMEQDFPKAITMLRTALKLNPDLTLAWQSLGNSLCSMGSFAAAVACYIHVLGKQPKFVAALHNLGNALLSMKKYGIAESRLRYAIWLEPHGEQSYNTLGNVYFAQDQYAAAAALYELSVAMKANYAAGFTNYGNALLSLHRGPEAIRAYEKALALDSKSPGVRYNLALAYLREGHFEQGWREHEARWDFKELRIPRRKFRQPMWDGRPLPAQSRLLVYSEQGLGDCIQFCRYIPLVCRLADHVIFEVPKRLHSLMQHNYGHKAQIIERNDDLPEFDCRAPLMSLPMLFNTTLATIPIEFQYLYWPATYENLWSRDRVLRIGLAWAGNPGYKSDKTRSMDYKPLAKLYRSPHIRWFSLQRDKPEDTAHLERSISLETTPEPTDMSDTAAVINALDLVVTTDTAVAHLAAAMGKSVWLMLAYLPDWRWMNHIGHSPWYPPMKLYRQTEPGGWDGVISRINQALHHMVIFRDLMSA